MNHVRYFQKRTRIISTLGPATSSPRAIEGIIRAGTDIVRLNLSHGTVEEHAGYIQTVRDLSRRTGKNTAILMDLPGPKYRIGSIKSGQVILRKGALITLTTRQVEGNDDVLPVNLQSLPADVRPGDTVLLADGAMQLRIEQITGSEIRCRIVVGGILESNKGLVVPGRHISIPYITDSMRNEITFAVRQQADFLALSFVSNADDMNNVRQILRDENVEIPLIAKIEREEAVRNFASILKASDAVMIARGDLGVEIPLERVPMIQKEIIRQCNHAGKPVITATEMLESMITSARPTRAETTDVANAIFDGSDAVMLSGETAVGKYPVQTVKMMAKIAIEAEKKLPYVEMLTEKGGWIEPETDELISYNACHTAQRLGPAAIVAYTQSGSTARRVSRFRPKMPILALTPNDTVSRQLLLCWGVYPIRVAIPATVDEIFTTASKLTKDSGLTKPGDLIVITAGVPTGQTGTTNMLKVERIE